jgi:two-component system, OmpR family, sensor kinase
VIGAGVLIVLAGIGVAIVQSSLQPLRDIERTAAAIAAGDLSQRVPESAPETEAGRLARALNAMLAQIEWAFRARAASEHRMRQFVADASHELRTPLTTIRGFAELYRQGAAREPEETAALLKRIEDEAARMGLLVEDLLLLARLDEERPLTMAPLDLRVIANDAVEAARAVAPDRTITLEMERDEPMIVEGDESRLRQVVGNLVTNALTHTPAGTPVALRLRVDGTDALLEVADSGPGLSEEQAQRVFERFYRVDKARTRRAAGSTQAVTPHSGTGLGLAIVAGLVAVHHGTVSVYSTLGGGATFQVRLPLTAGSQPDDSAPEAAVGTVKA